MKKRVLVLFVLLAPLATSAYGDTLYFKKGNKVEGTILEKDNYTVRIQVGHLVYTYYLNEIDKIETGPIVPLITGAGGTAWLAVDEVLSKEKHKLIIRLLDTNGSRYGMNRRFAQIIRDAPLESQAQLRAIFNADEIIERLVPVYAKYYTLQEIREMINFYKSPVGRKMLDLNPLLVEETLQETVKYIQEKMPAMVPTAEVAPGSAATTPVSP